METWEAGVPVGGPGPGPSPKSYGRAVALSAVLGWMGAHHFYLGRVGEGLLDLGLSVGWLVAFALGHPLLGVVLFLADGLHAFVVTVLLLTGNFRDGAGRVVAFPGQRLGAELHNHPMRRTP
jgi:TM2 domain-containing membrane protein YozV